MKIFDFKLLKTLPSALQIMTETSAKYVGITFSPLNLFWNSTFPFELKNEWNKSSHNSTILLSIWLDKVKIESIV